MFLKASSCVNAEKLNHFNDYKTEKCHNFNDYKTEKCHMQDNVFCYMKHLMTWSIVIHIYMMQILMQIRKNLSPFQFKAAVVKLEEEILVFFTLLAKIRIKNFKQELCPGPWSPKIQPELQFCFHGMLIVLEKLSVW